MISASGASTLTIENSLIERNTKSQLSTIVIDNAYAVYFRNSVFMNNTGDLTSSQGGVAYISVSNQVLIDNCTFIANSGWEGGALFLDCTETSTIAWNCFVSNSRFIGNIV